MVRVVKGRVVLSERDFQSQILNVAEALGWLCYHTWSSMHSASGFPDLVLVRPPRLLFVELKADSQSLSPAQEEWMEVLARIETAGAGIEVYTWRPADWSDVERVLR